jgi:virulence factor Mce-like protein
VRLPGRKAKAAGRKTPPNPVTIGAVVVLLIVALTYAVFHKRVPFTGRWTLRGEFSSTAQIRSGAPVRIAGVTVGSVTGTSRGPGTTAIVSMTINNAGQPIHSDATLEIHPRLFLEGGYYVQVDPGSPSAPVVHSGFTVPLGHTQIPVQFFTVLSTLDLPTRTALISSLHDLHIGLAGGGAQAYDQLTQQLPATFKSGAVVAQAFQGSAPNDVQHLIEGANGVSRALAAHDQALGGLLHSYAGVAGALAANTQALSAGIQQLDATLAATPPALTALRGVLPTLEQFSSDVRPALQQAPPVLNRTVLLLREIDALSQPAQLPTLIGLLHPVVQALPQLAGELEPLFRRLLPTVTCLNDQAVPALTATLDDGALSSGRPVWQDLVHALVGLGADAGNFDGNGNWSRFYGAVGPATLTVVPGIGQVLASSGYTGTRPQWNGPGGGAPFRPDVVCTTQKLGSLAAAAVPALDTRSAPASNRSLPSRAQALRLLRHPPVHPRIAKKVIG